MTERDTYLPADYREISMYAQQMERSAARRQPAAAAAAAQQNHMEEEAMSYEELLELAERIGHVSRGAPLSLIRRVCTTQTFTPTPPHSDGNTCCICMAHYEDDELVCTLPCAHRFHRECVEEWLQINKVCPLCKQSIDPHDTEAPPSHELAAQSAQSLLQRCRGRLMQSRQRIVPASQVALSSLFERLRRVASVRPLPIVASSSGGAFGGGQEEVRVDVVDVISGTLLGDGRIVQGSVEGQIEVRCRMKQATLLHMRLAGTHAITASDTHQCAWSEDPHGSGDVEHDSDDDDVAVIISPRIDHGVSESITFIPPHDNNGSCFVLGNYDIAPQPSWHVPLGVEASILVTGSGSSGVQVCVSVKGLVLQGGGGDALVEGVVIYLLLPVHTESADVRASSGRVSQMSEATKMVSWKIGSVDASATHKLEGTLHLPPTVPPPTLGGVGLVANIFFEIAGFGVSGVRATSLKAEQDQGKGIAKHARCCVRAGQVRCLARWECV